MCSHIGQRSAALTSLFDSRSQLDSGLPLMRWVPQLSAAHVMHARVAPVTILAQSYVVQVAATMMQFCKQVPGTAIFIDDFHGCRGLPGAIFLLTHCHSDHMSGLNGPSWRRGFLHCSHVSAALLALRKKCSSSVVRAHDLDVPFQLEDPLHPRWSLTATFVSANHCPGAVMIIIEGLPDGVLLHTGDFRYCNELTQNPTLRQVSSNQCALYLDVTFAAADASLKSFPSKEHSIAQLLNLIDKFHSERVLLHSNQLGDEELLDAVATHVAPEKLGFLDKTRFELIKTTDPQFCATSCVLLDNHHQFHGRVIVGSGKSLKCCKQEGLQGIEINCSTLWWMTQRQWHQASLRDGSVPVLDGDNVWRVLWAMHSSLEELQFFTRWIRPITITATCPCFDYSDSALGSRDFSHLLCESQRWPQRDVLRVHEESQDDVVGTQEGDVVGTQEGARFPKRDDFVSPLAGDTLDLLINSDSVPIFGAFHTMPTRQAASADGCAHQQWKTRSQRRRSDSDICCVDSHASNVADHISELEDANAELQTPTSTPLLPRAAPSRSPAPAKRRRDNDEICCVDSDSDISCVAGGSCAAPASSERLSAAPAEVFRRRTLVERPTEIDCTTTEDEGELYAFFGLKKPL
jgi:hypothetical protein